MLQSCNDYLTKVLRDGSISKSGAGIDSNSRVNQNTILAGVTYLSYMIKTSSVYLNSDEKYLPEYALLM